MMIDLRVSFQSKVLDMARYLFIMVFGKLAVVRMDHINVHALDGKRRELYEFENIP